MLRPKGNDGELQVAGTDAFPVKGDLENAIDLSFGHERVLKKLPVFFLGEVVALGISVQMR